MYGRAVDATPGGGGRGAVVDADRLSRALWYSLVDPAHEPERVDRLHELLAEDQGGDAGGAELPHHVQHLERHLRGREGRRKAEEDEIRTRRNEGMKDWRNEGCIREQTNR